MKKMRILKKVETAFNKCKRALLCRMSATYNRGVLARRMLGANLDNLDEANDCFYEMTITQTPRYAKGALADLFDKYGSDKGSGHGGGITLTRIFRIPMRGYTRGFSSRSGCE